MAKRTYESQEEFVKAIYNLVKDEYTVLGEYKCNSYPVLMRHNVCGHEWMVLPSNFINHGTRCPIEKNVRTKLTTDKFKCKLESINKNIELIDEYIGYHTKIRFKCKIDNHIWDVTPANVLNGCGCPVCSGKTVVKGVNDLWTTHPEVAKLLKNPEDGYKYSFGTHKELRFVCKICGNIKKCRPNSLYKDNNIIFRCCVCSDGVSYPEKFILNILHQLNVGFVFQLTSKQFEWVEKYRYDFYLPKYNCIIEVHGLQHYEQGGEKSYFKSLEEEKANDRLKKEIALKNGINKYVVIDARYSEKQWMQTSVLNSDLSLMFDLSSIDWECCDLNARKSLLKQVCEDWNKFKDFDILKDKYMLNITTIRNYLTAGSKAGICSYHEDSDIIRARTNEKISDKLGKKVYCHMTGEVFKSITYIQNTYHVSGISRACIQGIKAYGSNWSFVKDLPQDFEMIKTELTFGEYIKHIRQI